MAKREETLNRKLLAAAVTATKVKEIKSLLEQGADIHTQNEWGLTPIMLAAQYNPSVNVMRALLEAGADIQKQNPSIDPMLCTLLQTRAQVPRSSRRCLKQEQT